MRQPRKSSLSSKTMVDGETRASQPSLGSPHHCGVFLVQTLVLTVRRAQRRLACTSICYDVGFGVQCNAGDDHAHHVVFLSRSRLARHCVGTKHRHTDWNSCYSSAVQFDELDCWHHCHDDIIDLVVTCWNDNDCRCFLAPGLGFCSGQGVSVLFLH